VIAIKACVKDATAIGILGRGWMLKITRAANGEVVIKLSGRMEAGNLGELEKLISAEADGRRIILDLKDLKLVDQGAVNFLRRCEADSIQLKNCPAYIREWITGEQNRRPNK
jgi:hypothetical protein